MYKACTDWVSWDVESRSQYLHALLNAVHIYALPPKFLKNQLLSCPILSKVNPDVLSVLNKSVFSVYSMKLINQLFAALCVWLLLPFFLTPRLMPVRTSCQKSFRKWHWWSFLLHQIVEANSSTLLAGKFLIYSQQQINVYSEMCRL